MGRRLDTIGYEIVCGIAPRVPRRHNLYPRSWHTPALPRTRGRPGRGRMGGMARVVLVEPYYGGSHRAWADGWRAHSRHEIHLVTHDAAYWRWRLRGSALTLAEEVAAVIDRHGPPEVLVASDMVHLAALLGFLRRDRGTSRWRSTCTRAG